MIRRTCFPSTLRLMPVIHESTSVNSKPSLAARTWSVQALAPAAVASMRVRARSPREADQPGHPIRAVFGGAREVAEPGMRAHHHQHVRKAIDQDAEKGLRPVLPPLLQRHPVDAADVDAVESAGD